MIIGPLRSVPKSLGRSRLLGPECGAALKGICSGAFRPLQAATLLPQPVAAPGLAGRVRACKREPLPRRRTARRRAPASTVGLQTQVHEDFLDHRLLKDGGDDLQLAAAVRAVLEVEIKHALEQPHPTQPHRAVVRTVRLALGRWRIFCSSALACRARKPTLRPRPQVCTA